MKTIHSVFFLMIFLSPPLGIEIFSQSVGIGAAQFTPNASSLLELRSVTQGTLITRMTTLQMNAIIAPAPGLVIYDTDCNVFEYWNGTVWIPFPSGSTSPATPGAIVGPTVPCINSTGIAFSIALVAGATNYVWTVPPGATVVTGQGTVAITVNFGTTNGNVCVTASNPCGTSSPGC